MRSITEYETALLAILVASPHLADELGVSSDLFFSRDCTDVFTALVAAREAMPLPDKLGIMDELHKAGRDDLDGYLAGLAPPISSANATFYVGKLAEHERKRAMRAALNQALENIEDPTISAEDMADTTLEAIQKALFEVSANDSPSLAKIMPAYLIGLGERQSRYNNGGLCLITSGVRSLDALMGPIMPGEVVVIAARPGCGKTAFVMQLGIETASVSHIPTCFFSLEMTRDQMVDRMMVSSGIASMVDLRTGRLSEGQLAQAQAACGSMQEAPLYIYAEAPTPAVLHSQIRREVAANSVKLVIVDYLGLIDGLGSDKNGARWEKVGEESRALKRLALTLGVAIVLCVQLGRDADGSEPTIAMLRDSGSVEQDSDRVLLLYPAGEFDFDGRRQVKVKVGKNRHGPTGEVALMFDGRHMVFGEDGPNA